MRYKKQYSKTLCENCTLDKDCYCQNKSQKSVNNCGMEAVLAANKKIQKDVKNGRLMPEKE